MKKLGPKADPRKGGGSKEKGAKRAWSDHRTKEKKKKGGGGGRGSGGRKRREGGDIFKNGRIKGKALGRWWVKYT